MFDWKKTPRKTWFVVLALIGVLLMSVGSFVEGQKAPPDTGSLSTERGGGEHGSGIAAQEAELESRLENILQQVRGAGAVTVRVVLKESREADYARNTEVTRRTSEDRGQEGVTRATEDENSRDEVVLTGGQVAGQRPVIVKEYGAKIAGVLVVAEGASDSTVQEELTRAVCSVLDLSPHRVTVLPRFQ